MKLLFLLESTRCDDQFLYTKAIVESLAADGYEPKIAFTTHGAPSDHTFQLVKDHVVHQLTKLCFTSTEAGYEKRLANHLSKYGYDYLVVTQSQFSGFKIASLYEQMEHQPRLIFVGNQCSAGVTQAAAEVAHLDPLWVAVSQLVATRYMPNYDVQVINGPAVLPDATGADIRADFAINKSLKLLGYMGNVDDVEWEPVIEACKRMRVGLLIAGTGGKIEQLSDVRGPVKVVPAIPQCRKEWYEAIDCFVYPVRGAGFPMLPLEAALCGCPVAMTPVSDMYQLCQGHFQFFKFQPEQIIKAVQSAVAGGSAEKFVSETFSREKFLSGWQMLLSYQLSQ